MNKRLTQKDRAALEARFKLLRTAGMDAGKISGIVDKVGPDSPDIASVIVSLMKAMDASPEAGKYHLAARKNRLARILKTAMDMVENPDSDESPQEEAMDFQDPAMHMVEDLEHEVQTMDDHRLIKEVKQLEQHMKEDLAKMPPEHEHEAPPPFPPKDDKEKPELSAEGRLALLMSLPKSKRTAKASQLRALANTLEKDIRDVSQDNEMDEHSGPHELAADYEDEEMGSMKDVKAADLKKTVKKILAAMDESAEEEKEEEKEDKEDEKVEAAMKLALRHLIASIEDMEDADKEDEKEEKEEEDDKEGMSKEAGMPPWLKDKEDDKEDDDKEDEEDKEKDSEPTFDEKKAILRARLQTLKRSTANVDGKTMKTPKEVPSPSGTTEDNLKGDAKIQYQNTLGGTSLDEIQMKRQKVKEDPRIAGNDEPNAIYYSNAPSTLEDRATRDSDSSKGVNNKRVLKDEGQAVQSSTPGAGLDQMEMGAGSHQKEKAWEKAKSESDTTPHNDRMYGEASLKELIKLRTARASKLASHMANMGMISTESQITEKIAELASLDDDGFNLVASFIPKTAPASSSRTRRGSDFEFGEDNDDSPHHAVHHDEGANDDAEKDEEEVEEDRGYKEAGLVRRASANSRTASATSKMVNKSVNKGLKTPLLSGLEDVVSQRNSTIGRSRDGLVNKLASLGWKNDDLEAKRSKFLDESFREDI
jgi:hypothetical protein